MAIGIVEFDLSLKNPETGEYLTARTYTVDGVNNVDDTPRELSIGQLVMAICLQRATAVEAGIVALMEEMNLTSAKLEALTKIEEDILASTVNMNTSKLKYDGVEYTYKQFLQKPATGQEPPLSPLGENAIANVPDTASAASAQLISDIESAMDSMNSFSQQKMIELQSQTAKRDQAYDMISNILKSLNTVLVGIANNV